MAVDRRLEPHFAALQALNERDQERMPALKDGGDGGTYDGMETRVTKLETHFEYIRRDLDEMKVGQAKVIEKLNDLPTRNDLWQWKVQWTALVVAAIALIVGGIIGGLSWLKPDPAPAQPAPAVVYQPAPPAPAAEAPAPTPPQQ